MSIEVYTDGSYTKKGKIEYCGYGIYFPNGEYKNIGRKFTHEPITNNRAELYALQKTILICNIIYNENDKYKNNKNFCVNIYSDSEYSVKTINIWYKNWIKTKKEYLNADIIDKIMDLISKSPFKINITHCNSHIGIHGNEMADKLAKKGAFREN